jgi:hypothetical protein
MRRRSFLGLAALALAGCRRERPPPPPLDDRWKDLSFPAHEQRALLLAPRAEKPLPLLVALHGRGESGRGLEIGAHGWRDDYGLDALDQKLRTQTISAADMGDMVRPDRLARLNASLQKAPYEGLVVACPYTPLVSDRSPRGAEPFARFVMENLLPRARAEAKAADARERTGIDGVSMGGRLALLVGLQHPEVFGVVGALQPAIRVEEAELFTSLARAAKARAAVTLRLVSSDGDPFLPAVEALSKALAAAEVAHELVVTPGPHDYAWNRGPGGVEMLLGQERALRGLPAP